MQNYKTNCFNSDNYSIKCGDKSINFEKPIVMGILNLTPDSFYDGGSYLDKTSILKRSEQIISEGAKIIDLGAYSTRPGAAIVTEREELERMLPALEFICKEFPSAILSIDTFRSEVARKVVAEFGPCIINDISGGTMDDNMFALIGELKIPYIMMHIQGQPQTMQQNPVYVDLMKEVLSFFRSRIKKLNDLGATDIILDPGFGFGKTLDHNYEILSKLQDFNAFQLPILAGISRKSMIYKFLGGDPSSSLNGTTALHMAALQKGAAVLRTHDVKEAFECVQLYSKIKSFKE
ncbi:dihydropteroate synthase [Labilibaculum sp.]|uniref:dihydropteroate synthase n=1 Tax=Labilibaculum sp. TaxID=2060723 RepID=UPI00356B457A